MDRLILPQIERPLIRNEVYNVLKEQIVQGVLPPGEKLNDAELGEQMGVSRTPVREALRRLEDEGLVEAARNRWTRVAPVDVKQGEHIYPILGAVEALAATLAAPRLTREDLAAMEEANERLQAALAIEDKLGAAAADKKFHNIFVSRCENPYLVDTLANLKLSLRRVLIAYFQGTTSARASVTEHKRLLRAFRSGDANRVEEVARDNWEQSLKRFHRTIREGNAISTGQSLRTSEK